MSERNKEDIRKSMYGEFVLDDIPFTDLFDLIGKFIESGCTVTIDKLDGSYTCGSFHVIYSYKK